MNPFAALAEPIRNRPGDAHGIDREAYRRRGIEDHELTPEQLRKRQAARRRPNAGLPAVDNPWGLSPVQAAISDMSTEGLTNGEIAQRLDLSVKTVEVHVQHIKHRMSAPNRTRCAVLWDRFIRGMGQ